MRDLISIGRFAQVTGLTIKALHVYDAAGLLRPVVVDDASGYRYYSITQLPLARQIRLLRSVDMPLEMIDAVLHAPSVELKDARLREHEQSIIAHIAKKQQELGLLRQIIDHHSDDVAFAVQVKQVPAQLVASIRFQATAVDELRMIALRMSELEDYTTERGVRASDQPGLRISHEYSEDLVDTEVAVGILRPIPARERITIRTLEATAAACVTHTGPHADLWAIYWAILVWQQEHGYEQNGPPREVYLSPLSDAQSLSYRTEVQWPL